MISLEEYKEAFGKELLEEQVLRVRENQDQMAEIFFLYVVRREKKIKYY